MYHLVSWSRRLASYVHCTESGWCELPRPPCAGSLVSISSRTILVMHTCASQNVMIQSRVLGETFSTAIESLDCSHLTSCVRTNKYDAPIKPCHAVVSISLRYQPIAHCVALYIPYPIGQGVTDQSPINLSQTKDTWVWLWETTQYKATTISPNY